MWDDEGKLHGIHPEMRLSDFSSKLDEESIKHMVDWDWEGERRLSCLLHLLLLIPRRTFDEFGLMKNKISPFPFSFPVKIRES